MNKVILPYNTDAERAIFSIILLSPERFIEIADDLKAEDFYSLRNQEIWQAMSNLYERGIEFDIVSIKTELKKQDLDYQTALVELSQCYENPVLGGNLESFVKEVKNKSLLRQTIQMIEKHKQDAQFDEANALSVLTAVEKDIVELSEKVKDNRPADVKGILTEIKNDMLRGEASKWRGFDTGFKWLDKHTGGLISTHVWIVGSYTGIGKTFFLLQMILNILEQGAKVILFSTEMDRKMVMLRMVGNLAGLGTINMLKNRLDEEEKKRMEKAKKSLQSQKGSLIIYDNVYDVDEIRLKAKKQKIEYGLDVVVVDFIQNLRGEPDIYNRMSNAAIALQNIAQELKATMIIASQITQASAGWVSKEAIEYKGAGEIAAIADVGLWLQRVKTDITARRVILRKVRHGIPGKFLVRITFPSGRIVDMGEEELDKGETEVEDVQNQIADT